MRSEDLIYVILLLGSLGLSAVLRACPLAYRASASAVAGAGLVLYACSWRGALHLLTALCVALGALAVARGSLGANARLRGGVTVACVFVHLCCVRSLPSFPGGATNAAMLVLALRLGSIGFDDDASAASTPEVVRYALCYHGLFTAPYYSFRQWAAAMRSPTPLPPPRSLVRVLARCRAATISRQSPMTSRRSPMTSRQSPDDLPTTSRRSQVRVALATIGALLFWQATARMLPFSLAVSLDICSPLAP